MSLWVLLLLLTVSLSPRYELEVELQLQLEFGTIDTRNVFVSSESCPEITTNVIR